MQQLIAILKGTHTATLKGGSVVWKRRERRVDVNLNTMMAYLTDHVTKTKDIDLMIALRDPALQTTIQTWIDDTEKALLDKHNNLLRSIDVFASEEDYIKSKVREYGFTFSDRGDKIQVKLPNGNRRTVDIGDVEIKLEKDLDAYNWSIPDGAGRSFKISTLKATLRSMLNDADLLHLAALQDKMTYNAEMSDVTDRWLKNLHTVMQIAEPLDIWLMMMKHMMWLVKRRIYGLKVRSDLWISIFGGQNVGKTFVFTNCIFGPINDYYVMTELSKIEDVDREIVKFTENFVVNFDEIALGSSGEEAYKISDKMLNNLKSILTRDELYVRKMGGQDQMKLDKTFVAVSSANTHLYDVIYDKTGMRRFFEFTTTATTQYNNIHVAKLSEMAIDAWRGIDEELAGGYWLQESDLGKKVADIQRSYRPKNNITEWVKYDKITAAEKKIDIKLAYAAYKSFCDNMGLRAYSLSAYRDIIGHYFDTTEMEVGLALADTDVQQHHKSAIATWSRPAQSPAIGSIL